MKKFILKYKTVILLSIFIISIIGIVIFKNIKPEQEAIQDEVVQEEVVEVTALKKVNEYIINNLLQNTMDNTEESIENLEADIEEVEEAKENKVEATSVQTGTKSNKPSDQYYIKVNYGANVVTIYTQDENGNYTNAYKAMVCSTGTATPRSGVYKIKNRWRWLSLRGGVYGQYSTQIVGNILFHSVPYLKKSQDTLEYWEYDKLRNSLFYGVY